MNTPSDFETPEGDRARPRMEDIHPSMPEGDRQRVLDEILRVLRGESAGEES